MTTIHLKGKINEQGKLEVELPEGLPQSDVNVTLNILGKKDPNAWENQPWTEEELQIILNMKPEPKTNAEIAAWLMQEGNTGWEHIQMSSTEWIAQQRRKRRERNTW